MYDFQAVEMARDCLSDGSQPFYGILAGRKTNQGWQAVLVSGNISRDRTFVSLLAARCTQEQLDPRHLEDVVRDAVLQAYLEGTPVK